MFIRVDTDALAAAFGTFQQQLTAVEGTRSSLTTALTSVDWQGPAAAEFREQWHSVHEPALRHLHEALATFSQAMRVQNERYETVR
ncbi:MAG: WXG100 family type VII secretion target [Actinomycetes bacterium]